MDALLSPRAKQLGRPDELRALEDGDRRVPPGQGRAERAPGEGLQDEPSPHFERVFRCRACGLAVARTSDVFAFRADGSDQIFPNPLGTMVRIRTFRAASSLLSVGEPTLAFTWFSGFAWSIQVCGSCRAHIGWRYDRVDGEASPPRFFGLIVAALRLG